MEGGGGSSVKPLYSIRPLPAGTGPPEVRSIMAMAQPSSPELNCSSDGGQVAFGSGGWDDGTFQFSVTSPLEFEIGQAADWMLISGTAARVPSTPVGEAMPPDSAAAAWGLTAASRLTSRIT